MRTASLALAALLSSPALATAAQITFGPSNQDVTFTATSAGGGLTVTAPQLNLAAFDTVNSGLGNAWILGLDISTGLEVAGIYTTAPNTETYKYIAADGDYLEEHIHITTAQDNTTQPKLFFTGDAPFAITGDAAFVAALSGPDAGDWIMNSLGIVLDTLVGSASAKISAGQKEELAPPKIIEPANTLGLLGMSLAGLGLAARWRRRPQGGRQSV